MKTTFRSLLVIALLAVPLYADLEAGKRAYFNADYETAFKEWLAAAGQGDSLAALAVGVLYYEGIGIAENKVESVRWLRQAASRPDGIAEERLGGMYLVGDGVSKDEAASLEYLRRASAKGRQDAELMARIGSKQSGEDVLRWLQDRARSGGSSCLLNCPDYLLANLLVLGGTQYKLEAEKWLDYLYDHASPYDLWQMGMALCRRDSCSFKPQTSGDYMRFLHRSAEKGFAPAQETLGFLLNQESMLGTSGRPTAEGDYWLGRAAEQGDPKAQGLLASNFAFFTRPPNRVLAYKWYSLSMALGATDSTRKRFPSVDSQQRDKVASQMSADQISVASELVRTWKPKKEYTLTKESAFLNDLELELAKPHSEITAASTQPDLRSTGSGFVVDQFGHVVTNDHVVRGCNRIAAIVDGKHVALAAVANDPTNDLALFKLPAPAQAFASFAVSRAAKQGDSVLAVGFPLQGLLGSSVTVTAGTISALTGIRNDTRMLQFTAPVQPGSSGGPLLDQQAFVVGVVVGKLDALKMAAETGTLPENVNFAVKASILRVFLESNGIDYTAGSAPAKLDNSEIAERARKFTVAVECWK